MAAVAFEPPNIRCVIGCAGRLIGSVNCELVLPGGPYQLFLSSIRPSMPRDPEWSFCLISRMVWALAVDGYNPSTTGIHREQTFVVHVAPPMLLVPPAVLLVHSTP